MDEVVHHYETHNEEERLATGIMQLEFVRTQEILRRHLAPAPATVLDVGGGTGVHARWLAADGYRVHVVDVTPRHVEMVTTDLADLGVTAALGDARDLDAANRSYDVVLLLGPLYHLTDRNDRIAALREAARVAKPGALVAAAAISRFASLFDGLRREFIFDDEFKDMVERDLESGAHENPNQRPGWFTTAYFHHPDELPAEATEAGLVADDVYGVEGLAGWLPNLGERWADEHDRATILDATRAIETEPALLGLSAHLLLLAHTPHLL
jgi:ubiquinone/menaquinone biosynthesis C-methylase UbiE